MSDLIVQQLTEEIAAYVEKGAGAAFRDKAKHEAHTFSVSHSSIKNSITIAVNKAIGKRARTKINDNKNINIKNGLDILIEEAADTTINNIKRFFSITDTSKDFQVTITQVTGIDALKGAYDPIQDRYSNTAETIYDNIRNSFNYLKQEQGFIGQLNKFLQENEIRKKDIDRLNLVVGHVVSVSERRTRLSAEKIKSLISENEQTIGITWKQFINLFSNSDRVILRKLTTGKQKFTWEVAIEDGITNNPNKKLIQELGIVEAKLYGVYKKILDKMPQKFKSELIKSEGSDSLPTVIKKSILNKAKNTLKKDKRVKLKFKDDLTIKYPNGKPKRAYTKKYKPKKGSIKRTKITPPVLNIPELSQVDSSINLNALKAQINAKLSMTVIKNMGTPALENRTGRFARSVEVTDVIQTAKGFPSIGYTYQKGPYQTFEPGFAQGSTQRDPRVVISKSIREIAKELIVGRFYTRRV